MSEIHRKLPSHMTRGLSSAPTSRSFHVGRVPPRPSGSGRPGTGMGVPSKLHTRTVFPSARISLPIAATADMMFTGWNPSCIRKIHELHATSDDQDFACKANLLILLTTQCTACNSRAQACKHMSSQDPDSPTTMMKECLLQDEGNKRQRTNVTKQQSDECTHTTYPECVGLRTDPDDTLTNAVGAVQDHNWSQHECAVDTAAPAAATANHLSRHVRDTRDP
jgi:hypothetical protein